MKLENYLNPVFDKRVEFFFLNLKYPWDILKKISKQIDIFFEQIKNPVIIKVPTIISEKTNKEYLNGIFIQKTTYLEQNYYDPNYLIFIAAGTLLEAGAMIKSRTLILGPSEIRQGAYIRGNVIIGSHSIVGHTTEIKNSILMNHVEAGHFTYIGDSIIGSYTNLGAGSKISNLEFRTLQNKKENVFPSLDLNIKGNNINTKLSKFGSIIGEGTEIGCNAVLSPCILLGKESCVFPNVCVPKGVYPKSSKLTSLKQCKRSQL